MDEIRYFISDASRKVDVETHVLRYWEEELGITIPRNEMGHRYYTEFHIQLFCQVKKLKDKGYQLKAIKNALQQVMMHDQGLAETGVFLEEDMSRMLTGDGLQEENECEKGEDEGEGVQEDPQGGRIKPLLLDRGEAMEEEPGKEDEGMIPDVEENMEEDGQSDMKNRARNRKKPSAWERRSGVLSSEQQAEDVLPEMAMWGAGEEVSFGGSGVMQEADGQRGSGWMEKDGEEREEKGDGPAGGMEEEGIPCGGNDREDAYRTCENESAEEEGRDSGECFAVASREERMLRFQEIMNQIIGQALESSAERMSREISGMVNRRLTEEMEDLMRIRDEREEERYRQLDEIIRNFQREGQAEAAAARLPFFRKKRFGRNGKRLK